jgi:hypothetical protein
MVMFTNRTMAALFAIAIASSLIVASGFVGSVFAAKKVKKQYEYGTVPTVALSKDKSSSPKSECECWRFERGYRGH